MEFEQRDNGLWTRREVVTAIGTGVLAAACAKNEPAQGVSDSVPAAQPLSNAQPSDGTVKIRFYGLSMYQVGPRANLPNSVVSRSASILMPYAKATARTMHPDSTHAMEHTPYIAFFVEYGRDEDSNYKQAYSLQDKNLIITGKPSSVDPSFGSMLHLSKIFPATTRLRADTAAEPLPTSCRIQVIGGKWSALTSPYVGKWRVGRTFNSAAPQDLSPVVVGLEWDSELPKVAVQGTSDVTEIDANNGGVVVIGHLPSSVEPKRWWKVRPKVKKGESDHDFKWLYSLFIPRNNPQDAGDPWSDELEIDILLPAPRCYEAPNRLTPETVPLDPVTLGSSTCFGGWYP